MDYSHAGIPAARLRIRQPAVRPGFPAPSFRIQYVPPVSPQSVLPAAHASVIRYGSTYIRPPVRPAVRADTPESSSDLPIPSPDADVPGPSNRKRSNVHLGLATTSEEEAEDEEDPSEGSN